MRKCFSVSTAVFLVMCASCTLASDLWDAGHYKDNSRLQEEIARDLLATIQFSGKESILDIGCGDGKITYEVAQKLPEGTVVGVDVSANMIAGAQTYFCDETNLSFVVASGTDFSFSKPFDCIVSFSAFHWIHDQKKALNNIKKHLNDDGKLYIIMVSNNECQTEKAFQVFQASGRWEAAKAHREQTLFPGDVDTMTQMLHDVGFRTVKVYDKPTQFYFDAFDDLVEWYAGWINHCTNLEGDELFACCTDLAEEVYRMNGCDRSESVRPIYGLLYVEAEL